MFVSPEIRPLNSRWVLCMDPGWLSMLYLNPGLYMPNDRLYPGEYHLLPIGEVVGLDFFSEVPE